MEQFFLRLFGICDKLDVIHDKNVILPVLILKTVRAPSTYCIYIINRKSLTRHIKNFFVGVSFFEIISDGLNEVCFAVPGRSVNEERVIGLSRALKDSFCRGMRKLIKRSDDKCIKSVAGIQIVSLIYIKCLKIERSIVLWLRSRLFSFRSRRHTAMHGVLNCSYSAVETPKRFKD